MAKRNTNAQSTDEPKPSDPNQDSPTSTDDDPAAAPSPESAGAPSDSAGDNGVDWNELFMDDEPLEPPEEPAKPQGSDEPKPDETPAEPPKEPPAPEPTPEPTPEPEPATKPEEPKPDAPAEPPQEPKPTEPAQPEPDREKQRQDAMQYLSENRYALGEEYDKRLEEEPRAVLSELAGRLHVEIYDSILHSMQSMLPQFVQASVKQMETVDNFRSRFYSEWDNLKGHEDVAEQALQYARQINPNASEEDLINDAGLMATLKLKQPIPQSKLTTKQTNAKPAPAAEPAAPSDAPAEPTPPSGYTPAGPGAGTPQDAPPRNNIWDEFLEE